MVTRTNIRERAARLRPSSFVPSVQEITPQDADRVYGLEAVVSYWAGGRRAAGWIREAREEHGGAGFYVIRGGEVLGFLVSAPPSMLPRAFEFPVGPLDERATMLAYLEGDARTSRRLIVRLLRSLKERGVCRVESVASDIGAARHVQTSTLLSNGWLPVRRGWRRGKPYTLAGLDLGSAVESGELARSIMGHVRFPELRSPMPGVVSPVEVAKSAAMRPREVVNRSLPLR